MIQARFLLHARLVAELARCGFQERLDAGAFGNLKPGLGLDSRGNARCQQSPRLQAHVQAARKEALQYFQIGRGQLANAQRRQRHRVVRLGDGRGGEDLRGEGARAGLAHSGVSGSRSRTTSVPAARSPRRWCCLVMNMVITPTA